MTKTSLLVLPKEFEIYQDIQKNPLTSLEPLGKINIFVGSNNSGKSRFMRPLSAQEAYQVTIADMDLEAINTELRDVLNELESVMKKYGLSEAGSVAVNKIDNLKQLPITLSTEEDNYANIRQDLQSWSEINDLDRLVQSCDYRGGLLDAQTTPVFRDQIREISRKGYQIVQKIPKHTTKNNPKRVYIPILRGLRPLDSSHTDFYQQRTKQDYFSNVGDLRQPEIFTGLQLYSQLTDLLLGSNKERRIIAKYQEFISEALFEDQSITLIPNQKNKVVTVKIGNEADRPIYELGDGIQSAIILSFLPFTTKEPTFFFIEEPESHLHPGLQRKLLEFFSKVPEHTFFLTAHSNHLLDVTIDIDDLSVFTFRKHLDLDVENDEQSPTFTIENVDAAHRSSLELLGVRNSSVFLVNATIWVEGITDRWYLRAMLNSYMRHLENTEKLALKAEEDVHYCFVEYGGSNITHWSFLDAENHPIEVERLCARAMVIIDQDGNAKLERKEALEENLGERFVMLPCREIENVLPYEIIKAVVLDFEKTPDLEIPNFEQKDYQNEYLGRFIEGKMLKNTVKRIGGYDSNPSDHKKSGTIKSKPDFCKKIIEKIDSVTFYESLDKPIQEAVAKIYEFICKMNR